jgi:hypothetical protein
MRYSSRCKYRKRIILATPAVKVVLNRWVGAVVSFRIGSLENFSANLATGEDWKPRSTITPHVISWHIAEDHQATAGKSPRRSTKRGRRSGAEVVFSTQFRIRGALPMKSRAIVTAVLAAGLIYLLRLAARSLVCWAVAVAAASPAAVHPSRLVVPQRRSAAKSPAAVSPVAASRPASRSAAAR